MKWAKIARTVRSTAQIVNAETTAVKLEKIRAIVCKIVRVERFAAMALAMPGRLWLVVAVIAIIAATVLANMLASRARVVPGTAQQLFAVTALKKERNHAMALVVHRMGTLLVVQVIVYLSWV